MKKLIAQFIREDQGQDLIEYALLAGIITAALAASITTVKGLVLGYFNSLITAITPP